MEFYLILKGIMDEKGLNIPTVARMCGLSDGTVRSIIVRQQKNVALEVAFKLSDGLGVSLERLNGMPEPSKDVQSKRQAPEITPHELNLIYAYRKTNQDNRFIVDMALKSGKVLENEVWIQLKDRSYLKPLFQKLREHLAKDPAFDAVSSKSRYYVWLPMDTTDTPENPSSRE